MVGSVQDGTYTGVIQPISRVSSLRALFQRTGESLEVRVRRIGERLLAVFVLSTRRGKSVRNLLMASLELKRNDREGVLEA